MNKAWAIPRRTALKALGISIALPLLDVMEGGSALAEEPASIPRFRFRPPKHPIRLAMLNLPCGTLRPEWGYETLAQPQKGPGPTKKLKPLVTALADQSDKITFVSNLWNKSSDYHKISHLTNEANLWTCGVIRRTSGNDLSAGGTSVDQIAAQATESITRIPSLNFGTMRPPGGLIEGFSRVYLGYLSWSSIETPVPNEIDPRRAFSNLFNSTNEKATKYGNAIIASDPKDKESILDAVLEDISSISRIGSIADKRRIDEYLTSVRSVERTISRENRSPSSSFRIDPAAVRESSDLLRRINNEKQSDRGALIRSLLDLMILGFWTDSTRVGTMMFAHERQDTSYSFIDGVSTPHHEASHWQQSKEKEKSYRKINQWLAGHVGYLLRRMDSIRESNGGTLLDNSVVIWASGLNDGSTHRYDNLPVMVAGHGGGVFQGGQDVIMPAKTPLANLYLTALQAMGLEIDHFADSSGVIKALCKAS